MADASGKAEAPDDIAWLTARELAAAYGRHELSPWDVAAALFARIRALNPKINAFYELNEDGALRAAQESAARWRRGEPLGPLDGVPVSIKDHLQVKGMTTPRGSIRQPSAPSAFDCPAAARLREAGAVILGKTTMPELSVIPVTETAAFGITRNPWNLDHSPGGSSGGAAAAVAAGMGPLAVGSDGGGSIRLPAAFTNLVGLKPTLGRVPYWPGQTDRTVAGPIARTVADAAAMMSVIARPDGRDWMELPPETTDYSAELRHDLTGLRVAYSPTFGFQTVDAEVAAICEDAVKQIEKAGARVERIDKVGFDVFDIYMIQATLRLADILKASKPEDLEQFPPLVLSVLEYGARVRPQDIQTMYDRRNALGDALLAIFQEHDVIISPTAPFPAPTIGQFYPDGDIRSEANRLLIGFTAPFNLVHMPALSMPAGFTRAGLPVGLQIAGRKFSELTLLRVGQALETMCPLSDRHAEPGPAREDIQPRARGATRSA